METTATLTKTKWAIDKTHTQIQFKVKHLMVSSVTGKFTKFDGEIESYEDDLETTNVLFTVDADSITTGSEERDAHLRSPDFFDVEKYPKLIFKSTAMRKIDEEYYELYGNLTIKNITKQITLDVEYGGTVKDPYGKQVSGFTITGKIHRKDWDLKWNMPLETGGVLVNDDVKIMCEIELAKESEN